MSAVAWGREFGTVYTKTRKSDGYYYHIGGVEDALMAFERAKIGIDDCPVDIDGDDGIVF